MTIVAGDILRTSVNFTLGDGTMYQNVYHHQRSGIGIISDAVHVSAIADWVEEAYDFLVQQIHENVVAALSSVDLVEWDATKWEVVENIGTFVPATIPLATGDEQVNQVSPYVIFKTLRPQTVGRKFLFPLMEGSYLAGEVAAGVVANIVSYANVAVNDLVIQVLDNLIPGVVRTGVDAWHPFTLAIVGNIAGTQRRRRRGVGA